MDDVLIIEHVINHASRGTSLLLGAFGGGFGSGKFVFRVHYINNKLSHPLRSSWGAGWQQAALDDVLII